MERSTQRVLTTHTGSLPRPEAVREGDTSNRGGMIKAAVFEAVSLQAEAGIDIVSDGEMSKPGFVYYIRERLNGFEEVAPVSQFKLVEDYPGYQEWRRTTRLGSPRNTRPQAVCVGPLSWKDKGSLHEDIQNLKEAAQAAGVYQAFLPSASVGIIAQRLPNRYYPSYEAYIEALAETMHEEYSAITSSGLLLQIDAPEMCIDRNVPEFFDKPIEEFRARLEVWVEGLNHALEGIDQQKVRLHICWGNEEAPHTKDVALTDILDIVLKAKVGAYSIEAANPRHAHDWHIWEDTKLPDGKLLIPGCIDTTTNFVEHPDLVADRILTYARLVGRENIVAGTDCGFATTAAFSAVYTPIVWAKLESLAEGARRASNLLWSGD